MISLNEFLWDNVPENDNLAKVEDQTRVMNYTCMAICCVVNNTTKCTTTPCANGGQNCI